MRARIRPTVALLIETSRFYGRSLLRGIGKFARNHANWSLLHLEMSSNTPPPEWLGTARIDGILARIESSETAKQIERFNVPTVDLRCLFELKKIPRVETDDREVARLAFEHLSERGFQRFAYCGFALANYSVRRLEYFREFVHQAGATLEVYESAATSDSNTFEIERQGLIDTDSLIHWLTSLVPPTGLFVCNDIRGQQVINACRQAGLLVPDELGIIGVDNDDVICPICDPPLSSVCPDAEGVGFRAAEILSAMMQSIPPQTRSSLSNPMGWSHDPPLPFKPLTIETSLRLASSFASTRVKESKSPMSPIISRFQDEILNEDSNNSWAALPIRRLLAFALNE